MSSSNALFLKQNLLAGIVALLCVGFVWSISPGSDAPPSGIVSAKRQISNAVKPKDVKLYTSALLMPRNAKNIGILNAQVYFKEANSQEQLNKYVKKLASSVGAKGVLILDQNKQEDGVQTILAHVYQL